MYKNKTRFMAAYFVTKIIKWKTKMNRMSVFKIWNVLTPITKTIGDFYVKIVQILNTDIWFILVFHFIIFVTKYAAMNLVLFLYLPSGMNYPMGDQFLYFVI